MMKINDVEVILLQSKAHLKDTFLAWQGGSPFDLAKMVDPLNFLFNTASFITVSAIGLK